MELMCVLRQQVGIRQKMRQLLNKKNDKSVKRKEKDKKRTYKHKDERKSRYEKFSERSLKKSLKVVMGVRVRQELDG